MQHNVEYYSIQNTTLYRILHYTEYYIIQIIHNIEYYTIQNTTLYRILHYIE